MNTTVIIYVLMVLHGQHPGWNPAMEFANEHECKVVGSQLYPKGSWTDTGRVPRLGETSVRCIAVHKTPVP